MKRELKGKTEVNRVYVSATVYFAHILPFEKIEIERITKKPKHCNSPNVVFSPARSQ